MMKGRIKRGEGTLIANAGEYYVMAELLKRGIIAGLVPRNAPAFDILASNGSKAVSIRVKTKSEDQKEWRWNAKEDGAIFKHLSKEGDFTVLVNLAEKRENLEFYIIPTHLMDSWLKQIFSEWLETPGRNNRPHSPQNTVRTIWKDFGKVIEYKDAWGNMWQ